MKVSKGNYGYLTWKKRQAVIITVMLAAAVVAVYYIPKALLGTNENIFTIAAALLCLPLARAIVNLIMFMRTKECPESTRDTIQEHAGNLIQLYDLYLTSEKKNFPLLHAAVRDGVLFCLAQNPDMDMHECEKHIRRMMAQDRITGYTVKVYGNLRQYTAALDRMNTLGAETPGQAESSEAVRRLLCSIAL